MEPAKRILDSVHGYIKINTDLFRNIIDTVYFQRLRRVEQTSTRALFPSARHDRFIHSLGVFHLGTLIVESLKETLEYKDFPPKKDKLFESYKIACLVHDVGHSPFSHTFEEYFDNKDHNLSELIENEIQNETFKSDSLEYFVAAAPHEKISAFVTIKAFKDYIQTKADLELVVRMIIGCKYQDIENKSFENALIDLIHGDIIDADGLDYVKRDSWASGYSTSSVDTERLISSIRIHKNNNGYWQVCYSPKALNEIEAALAVKTYQQKNVITHHTVVFEQALLVKAMESAAIYHFGIANSEDPQIRKEALEKLCNVDAYLKEFLLPKTNVPVIYPVDDDFISLMKYNHNDKYIKQWLSRKYDYVPLWKTTADFFSIFPELHEHSYTSKYWLFSNSCKEFISKAAEVDISDIWILPATGKDKGVKASQINFLIDNKVIRYRDIYSNDKNTFENKTKYFAYIFVPRKLKEEGKLHNIIKQLQEEVSSRLIN